MRINRDKILQEYLKEVDKLFEQDEFMIHMTAKDCVNTVCNIIEKLYEKDNNDIP